MHVEFFRKIRFELIRHHSDVMAIVSKSDVSFEMTLWANQILNKGRGAEQFNLLKTFKF